MKRPAALVALLLLAGGFPADRTSAAPSEAASLPMRVSTEGLTYDQYRQRQAEMMARLQADLPSRALDVPARVEISREDVRGVEAPALRGEPLRVGVVKGLAPRVDIDGLAGARRGAGGPTRDGGYVWALAVQSSGAGALRLHVEGMELPSGAEMYVFSRMGEAFGPYRFNGPNGDGEFWTDTVFGTEAILQVRLAAPATADDLSSAAFSLTEVGIVLPRFAGEFTPQPTPPQTTFPCGNPTCLVDATCNTTAAPAVPAKSAAAKMEWTQGSFIYTCTGTLINDTNPSQDNFFLTAAHCVGNNKTAGNLQLYWKFATSSCNGTCPDNAGWPYKTAGATMAATGKKGDYTLLHLNAPPPSGSVFLGWNSTPIANTSGAHLYRISNPDFGPQVYSQHDVDTAFGACGGWPRGNWVYSRDIVGAIDGGSSGSAILNSASEIVGQLSGTCGGNVSSACDSGPGEANTTVDGAFASYFASIKPIINP